MQKNLNSGYFIYQTKGKNEVEKLLRNMRINRNDFEELNQKNLDSILAGETVKIPYRLSGCQVGRFYNLNRTDSLKAIARRQGLKVSQLLEQNPYFNPGKAYLGQMIVLSENFRRSENFRGPENFMQSENSKETEKDCMEYVTEKSDTLADILRKFDLSIRELQEENREADVFALKPGQMLHIRKKEGSKKRTYILAENETLMSVAEKLDKPVIAILKANPNLRPLEIKQGTKIILPD